MSNDKVITLSNLSKVWIFDIDGTIVKHNGYKLDGFDTLLEHAKKFLESIPDDDMIIFITARKKEYKDITIKFLRDNNIRYNHIIFEAPVGERILINDMKPSGLKLSYAINSKRNEFFKDKIVINKNL